MSWRVFCKLLLILIFLVISVPLVAQSITSGDIVGVVSDPHGAVVPNAKVTATNDNTGEARSTNSNAEGFYRFSFLKPGSYTVAANAQGFQPGTLKVQVAVGQSASGNIALRLEATSTTVEVSAAPVQLDNADVSTGFGAEQIAQVPNPGNDLSAIAQTSPGAVMNTQAGFGNFSTFGLPGTSNLFTIDGQNDNDPFLNLNNSGATNLLLGANDVQEATVTNNGYSGQYGQLAGSQINYVTKSGGNNFHGNAIYYWNGRTMNANDYLNNLAIAGSKSTPRPFDNVNQWAASFGGPIVKDKTFFFFNYEGLRIVIPTSGKVRVPSDQFEAATIANLNSSGSAASVPFYSNLFSLYNGTPGRANGTPLACSSFSSFSGTLAGGAPCGLSVQNTATNFTHEFDWSLKIDQKIGAGDTLSGRIQQDHGVQATFTDRINPIFNALSDQPEWQGQLSETHVFNPNIVNEFKGSVLWYSAIFKNQDIAATLKTFPTTLEFTGGFSRLGGEDFVWPQGRNVTQIQGVDDLAVTAGKHTFKFGVNYRHYNVTDFDYGFFTSGLAFTSVDTFFNGGTDFFEQAFLSRSSQPIVLWALGAYAQDEWRVSSKLRLTLALRVDHNSNPTCATNCFAELVAPFTSLNHNPNVPYNQVINTGLNQAYPSTDSIVWQPRFGFAFSPFSNNKTVFRGGIGIFGDSFPAVLVDNFSSNPPVLNTFAVAGPLAPAQAGNVFSLASASNQAFTNGFSHGQTLAQIEAATVAATGFDFTPPNITASDRNIRQPRYQEWNLEFQQNLGFNTVLSLNYVGNHGVFEAVQNNGVNAFGFGGLPPAQTVTLGGHDFTCGPDCRFSTVNQIQSIAVSNYNGLVTSVRKQFSHGLAFQANYTWSHAFDEVSNGGLLQFNFNTNTSLLNPINPFNIRQSYGPADYDVRHYFSANYVWDNALRHLFRWGPNVVFSGWTFSGTIFSRTGLPFSVIDSGTSAMLNGQNYGGTILAQIVGPTTLGGCGKPNATPDATTGNVNPCLDGNGFASPTSVAVNQARNQFRGPSYFNTDFTVQKGFRLGRSERAPELVVGAQFFNILNHPNFDQPNGDFGAFAGTPASPGDFGTITTTLNTPTSILGSFLGGDASPRLIQLKASIRF